MSAEKTFFAALQAHKEGAYGRAETLYRRLLADRGVAANHPLILFNLGLALTAQDRPGDAVVAYRKAIGLSPRYVEAHLNLGTVLMTLGRLEDAAASFGKAVGLDARAAAAFDNLGAVRKEQGRLEEALTARRQALALRPDDPAICGNLGNTLKDLGRLDEAAGLYRRAIALRPDHAESYRRLGDAAFEQVTLAKAVAAYRRSIRIAPTVALSHHHLGRALLQQGNHPAAIAALRRATALAPASAAAHHDLGCALGGAKLWHEAMASLRQALACDPDFLAPHVELSSFALGACDWETAATHGEILLSATRRGAGGINPFALLPLGATATDQLAAARDWATMIGRSARPLAGSPKKTGRERIRLGYLSADYHRHPVPSLAIGLFEGHDRAAFEVIAYSTGPDEDSAFRRRLTNAFDRFVDLRALSDRQAAERIAEDGIDILVDLSGYTSGGRARVLAYRPAPVQVSFLGYPGTMGADFIDYVIGDDILLPEAAQVFFQEKIVRLPGSFQPSDNHRETAAEPVSRAGCGLPDDGFVFCAFNNSYKITRPLFTLWLRLLKALPGSVLWLVEEPGPMRANLCRAAEAQGLSPSRLVFSPRTAYGDYLARLSLADLFLDTTPYNAGATANDALWAGLPLLTCAGETYVGRMASSLLTALGLAELVAPDLAAYETTALRLAEDPARLGELRRRLTERRNAGSAFDTGHYTAKIESAFRRMLEIHRQGGPPQAFRVSSRSVSV